MTSDRPVDQLLERLSAIDEWMAAEYEFAWRESPRDLTGMPTGKQPHNSGLPWFNNGVQRTRYARR